MVLESAGGCCESGNITSSLFYNKTAVIIEIMVAAVGVMDWFYL